MTSTIRRRIAAGAVTLMVLTGASVSAAQSSTSDGAWGAEARFGAGQEGFLKRYLNNDWSALLGGTFNFSKIDREDGAPSGKSMSFSPALIVRRSWGAGVVRPFIGAGPTVQYLRTENTNLPPSSSFTKSTSTSVGGRAEFGALVPINQLLSLGFVANVNLIRNSQEIEQGASGLATSSSKGTGFSTTLGTFQLAASLRF